MFILPIQDQSFFKKLMQFVLYMTNIKQRVRGDSLKEELLMLTQLLSEQVSPW